MYHKVIIAVLYIICVNGSGIYHENTKITFKAVTDAELFGYSVELTRFGLLVGAPKAWENRVQTGGAYNCSLRSMSSFTDSHPNTTVSCNSATLGMFSNLSSDYSKDDIWFGATIASLSDGKTLYCAPRSTKKFGRTHRLAHGLCVFHSERGDYIRDLLSGKGPSMREAFVIHDHKRREYGEYGTHLNYLAYGQAGMSVKVLKHKRGNNNIIIGAPGLLQWTGGILNFRYDPRGQYNNLSLQVISNPYYTPELGPDEYFGYSVEGGVFTLGGDELFVGGAPRSMRGFGQVLIFENAIYEQYPLKIYSRLRGPHLGSYFGASLCCLDIDGDGRSDLLVGAPTYVVKDGGLPYDQGAVFVYMTSQRAHKFNLTESGYVMGSGASGARFGTTIADLGDVDGDGFRDVAIGAPWENDGSGVVYIYRGTSNGLRSQYVQRIEAEGARSFGLSISKGVDVDNNKCNDLAIGAAMSNTSYLYRCVPTVTVTTSIKVPDAMNLPHNATGFTALFCVTARSQWSSVKVDFRAKIVIDPEEGRATISDSTNSIYNVSTTPGSNKCDEWTVDVKPTADLSKPIPIKFFLEPEELLKNDSTVFNHLAGRVSEDSQLSSSFLIQLVRDCGEDMICTPWLVMTLDSYDNPYTPGSSNKLGAKLTIKNTEEPAYGAKVNVTLPLIPMRLPSPCSLEGLVMACDVPAPLFRDEEVSWDIELEYKESNETELKIIAQIDDPLYNRNISKESVVEVVIEISPVAVFNVVGRSLPNHTISVAREKLYDGDYITFAHHFEISNFGPSSWLNTRFTIYFDMANLTSPVEGCVQGLSTMDNKTVLNCAWNVPAKVSRSMVLPLRFDVADFGDLLMQNNTLNITTYVILTNVIEGNWSATATTTLVLEPATPIWPIILGVVSGLVLLAAIVYLLYRFGFFSRQQHEKLKNLQDGQTDPLTPPEPDAGCSSGPSSVADVSSQEMLYDSD